MARARQGAAFYDLDGTLMGLNLVHGTLFAFTNLANGLGGSATSPGLATRLPTLYLAERRDRHLAQRHPLRDVQGNLARSLW